MKPLYLEFCGIKSFSSKTVINFENLLKSGIFGVFGDTGAGKSTILDSIGFALYGKVNRIGKDSSTMLEILNYNCDSGYADFTFEVQIEGERRRYRVERSINVKGVSKAVLYQEIDGVFTAVEEGVSRVNDKIEKEIMGIDFEDFKKCIALPQGEFSQFLQSSRKDRLALVSKLFSLEEYGYRLSSAVKTRMDQERANQNRLEGQLSSFEAIHEEYILSLQEELKKLQADRNIAVNEKKTEEDKFTTFSRWYEDEKQYKAATKKYYNLLLQKEKMEEVKNNLTSLQFALNAVQAEKEEKSNSEKLTQTEKDHAQTVKKIAEQEEKLSFSQTELSKQDFDGEIEKQTAYLTKAQGVKDFQIKKDQLDLQLKKSRNEYKDVKLRLDEFKDFDYDKQMQALSEELASLPVENNYLDYLSDNFKGVLLGKEYAAFKEELQGIAKEFPVTKEYVEPLLKKYSVEPVEAQVDIEKLAKKFKEASARKEEINKLTVELGKKNTSFNILIEKEKNLRESGTQLKEQYNELSKTIEEGLKNGSAEEIQKTIASLKKHKGDLQKEVDTLTASLSKLKADLSTQIASKKLYEENIKSCNSRKIENVKEGNFDSLESAKKLLAEIGDTQEAKEKVDNYFLQLSMAQGELSAAKIKCENLPEITEESISELKNGLQALEAKCTDITSNIAVVQSNLSDAKAKLVQKTALQKQLSTVNEKLSLLEQLFSLVSKDKFMEYIAVEYLQEIASNANNLLTKLTKGRYFLTYGERNFEVGDNYNEGKSRGVQTLSGGEMFLVSLSLALSLSASIQNNSLRPIEFFFLDEGFGTLDDELVDVVMDSLEKLKSQHFSIGIISHVGELKNRLESKIIVEKANEEHGSFIKVY